MQSLQFLVVSPFILFQRYSVFGARALNNRIHLLFCESREIQAVLVNRVTLVPGSLSQLGGEIINRKYRKPSCNSVR